MEHHQQPVPLLNTILQLDGRSDRFAPIFRVPHDLRSTDAQYEPAAIALGPYHRRREELQAMEQRKPHHLRNFLNRIQQPNPDSPLEEKFQACITAIQPLEDDARRCYSDEIGGIGEDDFREMMFLDGSFILEALMNPMEVARSSTVVSDILVIENQVPFCILQALLDLTNPVDVGTLQNLVHEFTKLFLRFDLNDPPVGQPSHLLHLVYSALVDPNHPDNQEILGTAPVPAGAARLAELGIRFRTADEGVPLAVRFEGGVLEMPQLRMSDLMIGVLQNLVVFEKCHLRERFVLDYLFFLKCLVHTGGDVGVLRRRGVLVSGTSEEKMVDSMARLCEKMVWESRGSLMEGLLVDLNTYCESPWNKFRADLVQVWNYKEYWAIIGIFLAIYALCFTSIQTYYTVQAYYKSDE